MLSPVKKRLVEYASSKGLKPYLLAEKSSIAKNTFANKSEISTENLIKVSTNFPDLNIDWVVTGRGKMLFENEAESNEWREKFKLLSDRIDQLKDAYFESTLKIMKESQENLLKTSISASDTIKNLSNGLMQKDDEIEQKNREIEQLKSLEKGKQQTA